MLEGDGMRILLAPDSFKESLSAQEVAEALASGFEKSQLDCQLEALPIGDGGEGTVAALVASLGMCYQHLEVSGPFGQPCQLAYAVKDDLALVEMAELVGLAKIPLDQRDPLSVSTFGLGQLLAHLAATGFKRVMIGVGGSASNDGGLGMAAGLGYEFFDEANQKLEPLGCNLGKVARFSDSQVPEQVKKLELTIITDVTNPLCGPQGATYVFAAQKGLAEADFAQVDRAMESFYQLVNPTVFELAGAGAGGGMGAGLVTFAGGQLVSGIDAILDLLDFDQKVKEANLVLVGEGRMDRQSLAGKAPIGVARRTPAGIPVIAVCGSLREDLPDFPVENIVAAFPIISKVDSLENTLASAYQNLERTACNIGNLLALSQGK